MRLKANELRLNRLNTPISTAIRALRFVRRYQSTIEDMTRQMIVRAISDEPGEFMRAIQNSEIPDCKQNAFAIASLFFKQQIRRLA